MGYIYIFGTIFFTVYGQLIIKWRIGNYGSLPAESLEKLIFIMKLFLDPFILSGFISAFLASMFWMAAMTKFELSYAYPFMGLTFVLVFLFSIFFMGENFNLYKLLGLILIVAGIIITSRAS
ncbi:MAG: EamA family transporter [Sulfurimonas sp.]|nr:EamA family transporter [Sulfurimonas sp.]